MYLVNEPTRGSPVDPETVLLPFVIEVYARFAGPDKPLPVTAYTPAVEISLQLLVARLFNDGVRSRQLLRGYVPAFADHPNLDDGPPLSRVDEIFWELSDDKGRQTAEQQIAQAALEGGILEKARQNARTSVTALQYGLGFRTVDVE